MKKEVILILLSVIAFCNVSFGQDVTADELFTRKFPKLTTEFFAKDTNVFPRSKIEVYREEYKRLTEASKELELFAFNGLTAENAKFFSLKELVDLKKTGEVKKLQDKIKTCRNDIKDLMKDKTQYGADSVESVLTISTMMELSRQNDWDNSYKAWSLLFRYYPLSSENVYITGRSIIEEKYKKVTQQIKKEQKAGNKTKVVELENLENKWIDTLLLIHDTRIQYFAKSGDDKGEILGRKAMDVHKYRSKEQFELVYLLSKESIELQGKSASPNVVNLFFVYSDKMYKENKLDAVNVVDNYFLSVEFLNEKITKYKEKLAAKEDEKTAKILDGYQKVLEQVNAIFVAGDYAKCEVLIPAFTKMIDANPDDLDLLKKAGKILSDKECTSSDLFEKVAIKLYDKEPNAESAYNLAIYYLKKEPAKYDEADKYLKEAYTQEQNPETKAKYYYQAAAVASKRNQLVNAKNLAFEALKYKSDYGDAYILIASVYANGKGTCGDAFEQNCVYWVVVDKLLTAKRVDSSVSDKVNSMISQYQSRFPKASEGFMRGITEGQTKTIECWINETTTARFSAD